MATSWEEASRCPKDGTQGEIVSDLPQGGGRLLTLTCPNERCPWYNTTFVVSIRPDGTIPDANKNRPKDYQKLPTDDGRHDVMLQRLLKQTQEGGEVR